MLKQKIIAAVTATLSTCVFAGTMGPICTPYSSTIPCETKQWDLGVQALYLKPTHSSHFAYISDSNPPYTARSNQWDWGYQLTGSYFFNTGNDINLNWTHYDVTSRNGALTTLPEFQIEDLIPYTSINKNRFDQVNLVLGQHVNFSQRQSLRFYGGLQYARISSDVTNDQFSTLDIPTDFNQLNNLTFNGVGPAIGIDFAYSLGLGFSLTANTESAILYGNSRNSYSATVPPGLVLNASYASNKTVVPSVEEKLGLNYAHQFTQGILTIDGGYQALNYFNALAVVQSSQVTSSDFGLFGPYFGIRWLGQA